MRRCPARNSSSFRAQGTFPISTNRKCLPARCAIFSWRLLDASHCAEGRRKTNLVATAQGCAPTAIIRAPCRLGKRQSVIEQEKQSHGRSHQQEDNRGSAAPGPSSGALHQGARDDGTA